MNLNHFYGGAVVLIFIFAALAFLTGGSKTHLTEYFSNLSENNSIESCIPFQKEKRIAIPTLKALDCPRNPLSPSEVTPLYVYRQPNYRLQNPELEPELKPMEPKMGRLLQTKLLYDGIWEEIPHVSLDKKREEIETKHWDLIPHKNEIPVSKIQNVPGFIKIPEKIAMNLEGLPDPNPCIDVSPDTFYVTVYHNKFEEE